MIILRVDDGHGIAIDEHHLRAVNAMNWRAYTHDDWQTCEVCNDCFRGEIRTTQMLSRFLMARIVGRELSDAETVRRKRQKIGTLWDFRDKNLELISRE